MANFEITWKYLASAVLLDINNRERFEVKGELFSSHKIIEGRKVSIIISIASIIEGCLRTYLILKVADVRKHHELYQKNVETYERLQDEEVSLGFLKPKEFYEKEILRLSKIKGRFNQNTKFSKLSNKEWNELHKAFNQIHNYDIGNSMNSIKQNLYEDVKYIFLFRNFLVHSNLININVSEEGEVEYQGMSKMLIAYLKKNNIIEEEGQNKTRYYIKELLPNDLIFHFKSVLLNFFKLTEFKELFWMQNEISSILK